MKFTSTFDIIGPVMVGPSSSHTAGVVRIGRLTRKLFGKTPTHADIYFYGSFAKSYKGHASDVAIIGGLLGFHTNDERVKESFKLAKEYGMDFNFFIEDAQTDHPNTVQLKVSDGNSSLEVIGVSIGGGAIEIIEINNMAVKITGNNPTVLVAHKDAYGAVADTTNILTKYEINIAHMEVSRKERKETAIMVIETDQNINEQALSELKQAKHVKRVICIDK